MQLWEQLKVCEGTLCRVFESQNGRSSILQLVFPEALQEEVLTNLHEGAMGGQLGVKKSPARLREILLAWMSQ